MSKAERTQSKSKVFQQEKDETLVVDKKSYPEPLTLGQAFLKATLLAVLFASIMLIITAVGVGMYLFSKLNTFAKAASTSVEELYNTAKTGWHQVPQATNGKKTFLILGTDSLTNRGNVPPLTDTMLFATVDLSTGKVQTLPLPRDLWSEAYKTKINALYSYGFDKYPDEPERFTTEVLSEMTGVPINHTLVLSIDTVSTVIDAIGGVDVAITTGFTDTQFPRSDVDIQTERDPKKLYETISFEPGVEHMNGERALKYMRSRHSEGETGTDLARGERQQQVIDAVLNKIKNPENLTDPQKAGELYKLYIDTFGKKLPPTEIIATLKSLYPHKSSIVHHSETISVYPKDPKGVITNPPISKHKQWVYEVRNLQSFQTEVQKDLGIIQ